MSRQSRQTHQINQTSHQIRQNRKSLQSNRPPTLLPIKEKAPPPSETLPYPQKAGPQETLQIQKADLQAEAAEEAVAPCRVALDG